MCVAYACTCVCLPPKLIINSGLIRISYDWLNKFKSFYVAVVVSIVSRHDISIDACRETQSNKRKLALYMLSIHFKSSLKWLYISSKT